MFLSIVECVSLLVLTIQDGRFGGEKPLVAKGGGSWLGVSICFFEGREVDGRPF